MLRPEPLASLNPLARGEFLGALMEAVKADGVTVLLSSHIIGDLERVCDYLVILSAAHVQLAGDINSIVGSHKLLIGPRGAADAVAATHTVVEEGGMGRQATLLVRASNPAVGPDWQIREATLEEIVLAYLGQPTAGGALYQGEPAPAGAEPSGTGG